MSDDSVRGISIPTGDGCLLEAEVWLPAEPVLGVVITHPHPTYGGDMHTPVPAALFHRARRWGAAALRFNFRGVGGSTGTHDGGCAERLDVAAALDQLAEAAPCRLIVTGWSFGADVGLAVDHDRLVGWMPVAAPLAVVPLDQMVAPTSAKPKHLLVPAHDQFRSPVAAYEATMSWPATTVETIPDADHFLAGGLGRVADALDRFLEALR